MKQANRYLCDLLDVDGPQADREVIWRGGRPTAVRVRKGVIIVRIPFRAQKQGLRIGNEPGTAPVERELIVRAYGPDIVRLTLALAGEVPNDRQNVMLEAWDKTLGPQPLRVRKTDTGWDVVDSRGIRRMAIATAYPPTRPWSDLMPPPPDAFGASIWPDGKVEVPFLQFDHLLTGSPDSLSLAYVARDGEPHRVAYALHAAHDERFAGTGERFAPINLAGQTLMLENADALGVNNRRAYKNVPFYVSSRPYGLLVMTSAHARLSLADISTKAAQGLVEDATLDLFFIGGGSIQRIVHNYRRMTGFPHNVPLWSLGTWMSRMTYWTADEANEVARRMRAEELPCDVIHLDTGWFDKNWCCDWEFSKEKYPDPRAFLDQMRAGGYRISVWQHPRIVQDNKWFDMAVKNHFINPPSEEERKQVSEFGNPPARQYQGAIDFTNPEALAWYQGLLDKLFKLGVSAVKADFGEDIDIPGTYRGMPDRLLHNLYALLYQKAVYEATIRARSEGVIWARAGWIGSQRYPVHWGGDCGSTWDGLAGTIRGGLHLGLSGFAFWSHDVPGFHGVPDFMNNWPAEDLYVRWTQVGVFTSHLRYHGANPREPYEYPGVVNIVRKWLRLRYALIPYIVDQARRCIASGLPMFRAMIFHHQDDPRCWEIDDQYYFGDTFLVAPVLDAGGKRDVYLPAGTWVDFWTGKTLEGPLWLKGVKSPLRRMPVYAAKGARIRVYPNRVQCTDQMDLKNAVMLAFDGRYQGLGRSVLGKVTGLS